MKPLLTIAILSVCFLGLGACTSHEETSTAQIEASDFGMLPDGTAIKCYTLTNTNGLIMKVITYGASMTALQVPDREGKLQDIILGYDSISGYLADGSFFGATVGRFANRIANGKFELDSTQYTLATNNSPNHLHGGVKGFDKVVWTATELEVADGVGLKLTYLSKDGEEGYPGNLKAAVSYILNNDNTLVFHYQATTDKNTIVNLTNHTYYNLSGMQENILGHELMINADTYLPVDSTLIPMEIMPVAGTPFDFKTPKLIGKDILTDHIQLTNGLGYDHCWILNPGKDSLNLAATLHDPKSGRLMEIYTTEPAIQFYSGNFLDGSKIGKDDIRYTHRMGLCLETQHYPDSPNRPDFPNVVLKPGEVYTSTTKTIFSTR